MIKINENIYGHKSRLDWFKQSITKDQVGLEFGCGTGIMLSSQLLQEGYNIYGIDLDCPSIELGKEIFTKHNLDPNKLLCKDLAHFEDNYFDYIIASEVFEHIYEKDIDAVINLITKKLKPNGVLFVTVPNGYGWFEFENIFWSMLGMRYIFRFLLISQAFNFIRKKTGRYVSEYPSTIANSPHVRRFTLNSIKKLMQKHNYQIEKQRGSVLFCGGFSDMFFSGIPFVMNLNLSLGKAFPSIAAGFYLTTINKK
ncbi:MAG: class I SAM-dependent methyltransferase [Flavobacteriales bacterium]|nr:class I SAM-dependent methyltransferase [Flavobacteriales bacterium]